jgi:hypothetical protein
MTKHLIHDLDLNGERIATPEATRLELCGVYCHKPWD